MGTINSDTLAYMWAISALPYAKNKKCLLIQRYKDKVSDRLKNELKELYAEGQRLSCEMMENLAREPNPLYARIEKSKDFTGSYLPVPIVFK